MCLVRCRTTGARDIASWMATDPFVTAVQRVGTTAALVPAQRALAFDASQFTVTNNPDTTVTAADGSSVTGVTRIGIKSTLSQPVRGSLTSANTTRNLIVYDNDTETDVTISGIGFRSTDDVTANDTDFMIVSLALASDVTTPILRWNTKTTGSGGEGDLTTGASVTLVDETTHDPTTTITVPAGDALVLRIEKNGNGAALGGLVQGHIGNA